MAKKRIEDIAIDRSKSFKRQLKKDLSMSKKQTSRNINVIDFKATKKFLPYEF